MKSKNGQKAFLLENTHADNKQKNIYNMAKIIEKENLNCENASKHTFFIVTCQHCNKKVLLRDDKLENDFYLCPCGEKNLILGAIEAVYSTDEAIEAGYLTQEEVYNWNNPIKRKKTPKEMLINDIMDNFDFAKVKTTMDCLDWTWASSNAKVPTLSEIKDSAYKLLSEAYDRETSMATGGFYVSYDKYKDDDE